MPFSAKAVANEFLKLAKRDGKSLSPMQLIKLVYFAHGWHIALAGKPLLNERVEAWKFGPVIPTLYHEFKRFGNEPITAFAQESGYRLVGSAIKLYANNVELEGDGAAFAKQLIEKVWQRYGKLTAIQLSNLTHTPDSPWSRTEGRDVKGTDISDVVIGDYFRALAQPK
jgi:uncharacterized phage-associated protein